MSLSAPSIANEQLAAAISVLNIITALNLYKSRFRSAILRMWHTQRADDSSSFVTNIGISVSNMGLFMQFIRLAGRLLASLNLTND